MKKYNRIAALLMTGIMLAGVTACNSSSGNTSTESPSASSESTESASADATDSGEAESDTPEAVDDSIVASMDGWGWETFDERVTITVPVYDRSKEGYPAVDDNYWTDWVQTQFGDVWNVDVNYVAIPRNDVMTNYALLIASGDTPTIMMEYDYPKVAQWATDGAMQTIDIDAFAEVAPTYYQKMVDNNQLAYTDLNGETYFVLSERPYYDSSYTYYTFVRMDWLRAVGYDEVPQNYEEQTDAINKIIEAGLCDDPIGLGIPSSAYVPNFGYRDFPNDEAEWAMHSSLGTASLSWEPTYKYLKRLNSEYNQGWISSEFDLETDSKGASSDQLQTDFINGNSYRYSGYMAANVDWLTAFYENNPDGELALQSGMVDYEEGVVDPVQTRADNPFGMIIGFSSYADENQLKAAWMLMEWMCQEDVLFALENGVEGVTYTIGEDGLPVVDADYRGDEMLNHNMNIDMTCLVHASKVTGTIEQNIAAIAPQGLPQDFTQDMIDGWYAGQETITSKGHSYSDPIFAVTIESESEYTATLLSLYQEYFAQLVKADPDQFDSLYETLSQQYLDAGYQEIIDERLEAYNSGMTTKLPQ